MSRRLRGYAQRTTTVTPLDSAIDEIVRLRSAIEKHRDDICEGEDFLRGADLNLWLVLKHPKAGL